MDIQFYGANCIALSNKSTRLIFDDNLAELGKKSITKADDVAIYTSGSDQVTPTSVKLTINSPGEYEVSDISIVGIAARSHMDEEGKHSATIYKVTANDINIVVTGHIYPQLSDEQLEAIGMVDVVLVPVGGHGYTLDPKGALTIIKEIEPKLVIPTHYASKEVKYPVPQLELSESLKELGMEPKETVAKLRIKPADLSDVMQLVVLEVS